ncbi:hypothetical protein FDA25_17980 [Clostridium botulinum]|nr:hypothetical protein [Clostridium botulinum]NFH74411.1 hypothetical protein [Clostridium botulinum]NFJ73816.1 hypothetical protein [Clostridium botulinum]NFN61300.1 hypothetical protein [Clostridium botulinum]
MLAINWMTVIVSTIISAITVQILLIINIKKLQKNILEFQKDTIEACTDEVAEYVSKKLKSIN